jgi:ACS family hexuronate transporter-like MFS transporter
MRHWLADRTVLWILFARFLFDPVFYFYMFWIPQYLNRERHLSLEEIGSRFWIPFLVLGFSQVLGGRVSDVLVRRGFRPVRARLSALAIAALITPVSWLSALAPTADWAIALMAVLMFAHGIWITNFLGLLGDVFPKGAIGTITGLTGTAGGIGGMLSNLLIGAVVDRFTFTPVFAVSGVLYPAALAVLLLATRSRAGSSD